MAKEICISSTSHETRLAILEDDQLSEIYYERENEYTLAGSIYNGRVTRVLPGMQSAFVDIGLERDAFLYVTDFIEMEESEENDEIERTSSGSAPQPVKPGSRVDGREPRAESRTEARSDSRNENRTRRAAVEAEVVKTAAPAAEIEDDAEGSDEPGGRRWRGRRRRGGRSSRSDEGAKEQTTAPGIAVEASSGSVVIEGGLEFDVEEEELEAPESTFSETESIAQHMTQNVAQPMPGERVERTARSDRGERSGRGDRGDRRDRNDRGGRGRDRDRGERRERPSYDSSDRGDSGSQPTGEAIVLPGEQLSKYGGKADESAVSESKSEPVRAASTFKPSTLIESPIVWDGAGLLPGETLSRYKKPAAEVVEASVAEVAPVVEIATIAEPEVEASDEAVAAHHLADHEEEIIDLDEDDEDEFAESGISDNLSERIEHAHSVVESLLDEDDEFEEEEQQDTVHTFVAEAGVEDELEREEIEEEELKPEAKKASHNVDPSSPAEFRLFGFGKKKEEKAEEKKPKYSPGVGKVEEEVIDGDEYVAKPRIQARAADIDFEEEERLGSRPQRGNRRGRNEGRGDVRTDVRNDSRTDGRIEEPQAASRRYEGEGDDSGSRRDRDRNRRGGRDNRAGQRRGAPRRTAQTTDLPIISDLLKPGQEILVQIAKEPIAKKGARITSHIALPGRFLVFMPTVSHVGVSRKISSDEERHRLKRILISERGDATGGFIVRTAAENASEEELRADLRFLLHLWSEIKQRSEGSKSPALIYHDLSLIERILRDQVSDNFSSIWVDSEADYERIVRFLNRFSPTLVRRVKLYTKELPLFEHFGIQDEISKALRSKVWLKSGGSIVINQTEALVAIDINTGKYVGKTARLEDTILKTNLDAIPEIVRQIRLRDLGGIIVIDFIDMDERKNRNKVMAALEDALKVDRAPTKVLQFNDFGLVAITRKRVKQSLERTLSIPCATCQATGMVKSPATVANEIFIELRKMRKHFESRDVMIRVHPETVKVLKGNNARWLADYEELVGKNILVKSDATLHPEQFDIQG